MGVEWLLCGGMNMLRRHPAFLAALLLISPTFALGEDSDYTDDYFTILLAEVDTQRTHIDECRNDVAILDEAFQYHERRVVQIFETIIDRMETIESDAADYSTDLAIAFRQRIANLETRMSTLEKDAEVCKRQVPRLIAAHEECVTSAFERGGNPFKAIILPDDASTASDSPLYRIRRQPEERSIRVIKNEPTVITFPEPVTGGWKSSRHFFIDRYENKLVVFLDSSDFPASGSPIIVRLDDGNLIGLRIIVVEEPSERDAIVHIEKN